MCVIQMAALVVVRVLDAPRAYPWMDELRWEVTSPMQAPSVPSSVRQTIGSIGNNKSKKATVLSVC